MLRSRLAALSLAAAAALTSCSDDPLTSASADPDFAAAKKSTADQYVIIGAGGALPADFADQVAAAGGTVVESVSEIGVAVVKSDRSTFRSDAERIGGVESVTPDHVVQWYEPPRTMDLGEATPQPVQPQVASLADDEPFYFLQWAPAAVQGPEAWNAGFTGNGVRVAILDGGLFNAHPDLAANVDVAASASFVPGFAYNEDTGTFWHGTHVAGIVGAGDNGIGVIGIAPDATLIGVKVLHSGSGAFSWVINGIIYAATPQSEGGGGADVINMSLGLTVDDAKDKALKHDYKELMKAVDLATKYAVQRGVTVIASAGNDALNHDANNVLTTPAQNHGVISIAATGPLGWALGATNFERPASYTNYGKKVVSLAAPGGDFALPGNDPCTVGFITRPCWVFDLYLSTSRGTTSSGSYSWAAGTSMASPVTAGIAALIIEAAGGSLSPAQVHSRLRQGAQDLGKPGNDAWYGHGWVNAYGSVGGEVLAAN